MKIRRDFVTNSSSSSYVISYNSIPEFDSETISKYPCVKVLVPLIEAIMYAESDYDTSAGDVVTSVEELNNYLVDRYGWKDRNTIEKLIEDEDVSDFEYTKYIEEINSGHSLLFKEIGYSDGALVDLFKLLDQADAGIKILFGD